MQWLVGFQIHPIRDLYLAAATHISSRAFPSSLLSLNPTLEAADDTKPILIPGVDSLNHKRAQPVTWSVNFPASTSAPGNQQPTISLILRENATAGSELFNNYGPKPNSELILGYGFSLPDNPDDTILLKISGIDKKWEIGRSAQGAVAIWDELFHIVEQDEDGGDQEVYETQMDVADTLASMVQVLLEKLPLEEKVKDIDIRPEVLKMWKDYIQGTFLCFSIGPLSFNLNVPGQTDILSSLLIFCQNKESEAVELARSSGIELVMESWVNRCSSPSHDREFPRLKGTSVPATKIPNSLISSGMRAAGLISGLISR